MSKQIITFPAFTGTRCLMMPYIQGDPYSVPDDYHTYRQIIEDVFIRKGDLGYLTIDESKAMAGKPHRGKRAKWSRAIHTEAGRRPGTTIYRWGGGWGRSGQVTLDCGVRILLANNLDDSCAIWDAEHADTSIDGDIGNESELYPYEDAAFMKAGEVSEIGILTPHESIPVRSDFDRQFLRIVSSGVHGRETYFTTNPVLDLPGPTTPIGEPGKLAISN